MRVLMRKQSNGHLLRMCAVKPGQLGRTAHPFLSDASHEAHHSPRSTVSKRREECSGSSSQKAVFKHRFLVGKSVLSRYLPFLPSHSALLPLPTAVGRGSTKAGCHRR
jgi:hypothetical protein